MDTKLLTGTTEFVQSHRLYHDELLLSPLS